MENRNFTLDQFNTSLTKMIGINDDSYRGRFDISRWDRTYEYSEEEVDNIIKSGTLPAKIELSRNFFKKDGIYRRIIIHYATLLKYCGILIPSPSYGKKLSNIAIQKKYHNAMNFIDSMNIPVICGNWALRALRDGTYYGVISQLDKKHFTVLDLPTRYSRTRFKDSLGNYIIEFDVRYFDSLPDEQGKAVAMAAYPREIVEYYYAYKKQTVKSEWCFVPTNIGICFPLYDGTPLLLNVIPASMKYDAAVERNDNKEAEEIRKIIVQQIPHLQDGSLLFEPEEAEVMHRGAVGMMKGNPNISVLTTYADVEGIVSRTTADTGSNYLSSVERNVYVKSGASGELFDSDSNLSLATSLKNDMALMITLTRQFDIFITSIINDIYANGNISFRYETLPITWYNETDYIDSGLKMANSGYSFLIPAIAMGLSQKDLGNIKDLENDVLDLRDKLIPLTTSYTQSSNAENAGGQEKKAEEKSDKTEANQESLDHGGSN